MEMWLYRSAFIMVMLSCVSGHGRLKEPPARNIMWRFGYHIDVNYNDNELFCGGRTVQWEKNDGKCGVCGDNWADKPPRDHEAGGKYGKGIIVRFYRPGQVINIESDITANHYGYIEIKMCPHNKPKEVVSQECLDRYPLQVIGGEGSKFVIPRDGKKKVLFKYQVKLPYVTCSHCVFQWTYHAGNTWGVCPDNSTEVGCGPQETFVNCADVAIVTSTATLPKPYPIFQLYYKTRSSLEKPVSDLDNVLWRRPALPDFDNSENAIYEPLVIKYDVCVPVGMFRSLPGMNKYCKENCLKYMPYCPDYMCKCYSDCYAVGEFSKKEMSDVYCLQTCLRYPIHCKDCGPVCPRNRCVCTP